MCTHTHTNSLLFLSKQYNSDFSPLTSHTVLLQRKLSADMTIIICTIRSDCLWHLFKKTQ